MPEGKGVLKGEWIYLQYFDVGNDKTTLNDMVKNRVK